MAALTNPLEAVTSFDPAPCYAALRAQGDFVRLPDTGLLTAASAAAVEAILSAPTARVRPAAEAVPSSIAGTQAGEIFSTFARMTDGPIQAAVKAAILQALGTCHPDLLAAQAAKYTRARIGASGGVNKVALTALSFSVPVECMAGAAGFEPAMQARIQELIAAFVWCISPLATPAQLSQANQAARDLVAETSRLLESGQPGLVATLRASFTSAGLRPDIALLANAIGLLSQTYDATAGLIGNTLVALARGPEHAAAFVAQNAFAMRFVHEVARHDAPIQNTRRFLAAPVELLGVHIPAHEPVLVLLAGANRDPAVNLDPDIFRPDRETPVCYTFSMRAHRCPGQDIAAAIATGVVRALLQAGLEPSGIDTSALTYVRSMNARIPIFAA